MQINQEIRDITNAIIAAVPVLQIYLFGSYAKGTATENSDYDFFVVIPDDGMRQIEAMQAISNDISLYEKKRPIDLLVGRKSRFDERKNWLATIEREVINTGVKLYG